MPDYRNMTAKEAIRAAKEESGLTIEQIARRLNVSTSVVKRYLKEDDVYSPRLDMLPRLCVVLGNTVLLDWMAGQIRQDDDERREKMVSLLTNAIDVLEEARFFVMKAEGITCREKEELHAALDEAELACGGIRDFLPHRKCGCGKRKGIWCPLWKFWQKYVRGGSGRRG